MEENEEMTSQISFDFTSVMNSFAEVMKEKFLKALTKDSNRSPTPWSTYSQAEMTLRLMDETKEYFGTLRLDAAYRILLRHLGRLNIGSFGADNPDTKEWLKRRDPKELIDIAIFSMILWAQANVKDLTRDSTQREESK